MQVVISIPEVFYEALKKTDIMVSGQRSGKTFMSVIYKAVAKGIPLPKGRLIDADELLKRISEKSKIPSLSEDTVNGLCGATAIIYDMLIESGQEKEADKESK